MIALPLNVTWCGQRITSSVTPPPVEEDFIAVDSGPDGIAVDSSSDLIRKD